MPATKQNVVITRPSPGTIQIAVGSETFTLPLAELHALWDGQRDVITLLWEMHLALRAAGVNPHTATPAQVKAAIEAQTYWWGN